MTLQLAAKAFNAGDLRSANQLCQQVLANDPNNSSAMNLMGAINGTVGRHDLAAEWMRKAVVLNPRELSYRTNLISALIRLNQHEDADAAIADGLAAFANHPQLLTLHGVVKGKLGDDEGAVESLQEAIRLNPNSSNAHFNLAVILRRQDKSEEALDLLKKAVKLDGNNVDALNNLAGLLLDSGNIQDSIRHMHSVLEKQPHSAQAYYNLSVAIEAAGDVHQSVVCLRNALKLDPNLERAKYKLINQLVARGMFDEAQVMLDDWQQQQPDNPQLISLRVRFFERQGKIAEAREAFDQIPTEARDALPVKLCEATILDVEGQKEKAAEILEKILEKREADAVESTGIRYSLGKLYDATKQFDKAFDSYAVGNTRRREAFRTPFDKDRTTTNMQEIAKAYAEGWKQRTAGSGHDSSVPIFIIGMPRSGTSLTEQILGSHRLVHAAGELQSFSMAIKATHGEDDAIEPQGDARFQIVENTIETSPVIPTDFEEATMKQIGKRYADHVATLANGEPYVTDKMPYNYLFAPLIKMALPNAKIIHTRRNPLDTCLSCFFQNFASGTEFAFDLEHVGVYYQNYESVMKSWRELDLEMLEIDYEDLVSDTEPVVRKMLDYCGLEFDAACLESHKNQRAVATASYQQVREPIYKKSVERWRNYEKHIQPLIELLGN